MRRAAPRPPSHATPGIRWKSKVFTPPDPSSRLQKLEGRAGSSLGKPAVHVMYSFPPLFSPVSQDFRGFFFASSQGEEANRWHCAVSGGAQPCWRPGAGCPSAGKALRFGGSFSPRGGTGKVSPWPFGHPEMLLLLCTMRNGYVCTRPLLTGKGTQTHPADQASVRKIRIPIENFFLPASSVAGAGRQDPSALCRRPAEEIGSGELIILAGDAGFLGSTAGSAGGPHLEFEFSPRGSPLFGMGRAPVRDGVMLGMG